MECRLKDRLIGFSKLHADVKQAAEHTEALADFARRDASRSTTTRLRNDTHSISLSTMRSPSDNREHLGIAESKGVPKRQLRRIPRPRRSWPTTPRSIAARRRRHRAWPCPPCKSSPPS